MTTQSLNFYGVYGYYVRQSFYTKWDLKKFFKWVFPNRLVRGEMWWESIVGNHFSFFFFFFFFFIWVQTLLTKINYEIWSIKMRVNLQAEDMWYTIEHGDVEKGKDMMTFSTTKQSFRTSFSCWKWRIRQMQRGRCRKQCIFMLNASRKQRCRPWRVSLRLSAWRTMNQ